LGVILLPRRFGRFVAAAPLLVLAGALSAAQTAPASPVRADPQVQVPVATAVFDDRAEARQLAAQRAERHRREAPVAPATAAIGAAPTAAAPKKAPPKQPAPAKSTGNTQPAPASGNLAAVVNFALSQIGKPYVWGAAGPGAYDCSGLVMAAYARIGKKLPHQSEAIAAMGTYVPKSQWQPGTVLHWSGHVAIYLGGGRMVHAPHPGASVTIANVYGSPTGLRM
jgi:cell wall-associated NlpC family hydrolase